MRSSRPPIVPPMPKIPLSRNAGEGQGEGAYLLQGRVITPERELAEATILVEGERITWVRRGAIEVRDITMLTTAGDTIVPGFVDLQVNGLAGHDAALGADAITAI